MAEIGLETSQYTRTYTAFSGIDMTVVAYNRALTTIQGLSYSITREKAPIYTMGSANPRAFTRGKRGIAGSCIFTVFDRHPLSIIMDQAQYVAKGEEVNDDKTVQSEGILYDAHTASNQMMTGDTLNLISGVRKPVYADQIPPFDMTIAARNEYGQMASMRIFGVEFLNEGSGTSVDDTTNEVQMTFVARHVSHWKHYNGDFDYVQQGDIGFRVSGDGSGPATVATKPAEL
jgi:hypothetical protein